MNPLRVLWCWPVRPSSLDETNGLAVEYFSGTQEDLTSSVSEAEAIVIRRGLTLDASVFAAAGQLQYVLRAGTNTANIDLEAARAHDVLVSATPMHIDMSVAEHAITLMLVLARNILQANRDVVDAGYEGLGLVPTPTSENFIATNWMGYDRVPTLFGRTLGLVGMGEIGTAVAGRARAFGMDVAYYKRSRLTRRVEESLGVRFADLGEIAETSDFVSLHVPDSDTTAHIVNAAFLRSMKSSAFLVNVSRGRLVDEAALIDALSGHRIAGAALDVFEQEPLPKESLLCTAPNVVLTPHIASGTDVTLDLDHLVGNLASVARGEMPNDVLLAG